MQGDRSTVSPSERRCTNRKCVIGAATALVVVAMVIVGALVTIKLTNDADLERLKVTLLANTLLSEPPHYWLTNACIICCSFYLHRTFGTYFSFFSGLTSHAGVFRHIFCSLPFLLSLGFGFQLVILLANLGRSLRCLVYCVTRHTTLKPQSPDWRKPTFWIASWTITYGHFMHKAQWSYSLSPSVGCNCLFYVSLWLFCRLDLLGLTTDVDLYLSCCSQCMYACDLSIMWLYCQTCNGLKLSFSWVS